MSFAYSETLTPKESILLDKETEENRLAREHALRMKQLDIQEKSLQLKLRLEDAKRSRAHQQELRKAEVAIRELEVKWQQLLRIPVLIIKLPIYIILALSYPIYVLTHQEPPRDYWQQLR